MMCPFRFQEVPEASIVRPFCATSSACSTSHVVDAGQLVSGAPDMKSSSRLLRGEFGEGIEMDDEITGMHEISKILDNLDDEARARVIRWAAEKFGVDLRLAPLDESAAIDDSDHTRFMGVDPDKLEAARDARAAQVAETRDAAVAPKLEVQPASPRQAHRGSAAARPRKAVVPGHTIPHVFRQAGAEKDQEERRLARVPTPRRPPSSCSLASVNFGSTRVARSAGEHSHQLQFEARPDILGSRRPTRVRSSLASGWTNVPRQPLV